jgi:hypothetical protein
VDDRAALHVAQLGEEVDLHVVVGERIQIVLGLAVDDATGEPGARHAARERRRGHRLFGIERPRDGAIPSHPGLT